MSKTEHLAPLLSVVSDLVAWLEATQVPGIIIGGVAASLLGRPRATRDVDAVVLVKEGEWDRFLAAGEQFGFVPRHSEALAFAQKSRVLLLRHQPSEIDVDVAFGALPFEEAAIARAKWSDVGGVRLPLPTPEDLIIMKAVANRPRDLADIESILDANAKLDLQYVRRWVGEFSAILDRPEILNDLEGVLSKVRPAGKRKKKR